MDPTKPFQCCKCEGRFFLHPDRDPEEGCPWCEWDDTKTEIERIKGLGRTLVKANTERFEAIRRMGKERDLAERRLEAFARNFERIQTANRRPSTQFTLFKDESRMERVLGTVAAGEVVIADAILAEEA